MLDNLSSFSFFIPVTQTISPEKQQPSYIQKDQIIQS